LDAQELLILKNLVQYAERRVTWAQEYRETSYLTPDVETWDNIQAVVATLEGKLMTNCEELAAYLGRIADALEAHTSEFETMATAQGLMPTATDNQTASIIAEMQLSLAELQSLNGVIGDGLESLGTSLDTGFSAVAGAVACVCNALQERVSASVVNPTVGGDQDVTNYWGYGSGIPDTSVGAQVDEEACALAQCWFQALYEVVTEWILPVSRFAFDNLVPAGAALIAAITGGAALPVVLGVWTFAELVQELLELGYDAAETNLVNWLWSVRQDFICEFYEPLKSGGSMASIWETVYLGLVSGSGSISPGDKAIVHIAGLTGAYLAWRAKQANSSWYQTTPEPGYCSVCPEPPTIGADWVAVPISEAEGLVNETNPSGGGWKYWCNVFTTNADRQIAGLIWKRTSWSGDGNVQAGPNSDCGGACSPFPAYSTGKQLEDHAAILFCDYNHINETNCRDTMIPGGELINDVDLCQGASAGVKTRFWTTFGGTIVGQWAYVVYKGAYWP
jgi:hypothetical protein